MRGRSTVIVVPAPGMLWAEMEPPCASTRLRLMASPRPDPWESAELEDVGQDIRRDAGSGVDA